MSSRFRVSGRFLQRSRSRWLACAREERRNRSRRESVPAGDSPDTIYPGGGSPPPLDPRAALYDNNAPALAEGQSLYNQMNCVGCHSHGGGGMGPPLMDDEWRYGGRIDQIVASIAQGRPNGMPSWRASSRPTRCGRSPPTSRSMSGQPSKDAVFQPLRRDERHRAADARLRGSRASVGQRPAMTASLRRAAALLALLLCACSYQTIRASSVERRCRTASSDPVLDLPRHLRGHVRARHRLPRCRNGAPGRAGEANVVETGRHRRSDPLMRSGLIGWGAVICNRPAALAIASFVADRSMAKAAVHRGLSITVTANQWWWDVQYNATDPSKMIRTANELHLPVGVPARIILHSNDVIHSFWVPSLAGKEDLIPGRDNDVTIGPRKIGIYRGQCAEFCGVQHAHMALVVNVDSYADFIKWWDRQMQPAPPPRKPLALAGYNLSPRVSARFATASPALRRADTVGPDLTHLAGRRTHRRRHPADERRQLYGWIADPQGHQARNEDAGGRPRARRASRRRRLSRDPQMTEHAPRLALSRPRDARGGRPQARRGAQEAGRDGPKLKGAKLAARLDAPGAGRPGFLGWLATVDHKEIGRRYIVTALIFFVLGGVLALLMRDAAGRPDKHLIGADALQPAVHDARLDDDVPVRRAGDGSRGGVPHPADARHALDRLPAPQRLQLLGVPVRRAAALRAFRSTSARTSAGSSTAAHRARNSRPASAPTSGRR